MLTEILTDFCSLDHKSADALAKIFFYRNTTSPAADFLSSTIAHEQCQILLLSFQAQIKENRTMSSEANISKVLFENPCIMWAGIYSNPI